MHINNITPSGYELVFFIFLRDMFIVNWLMAKKVEAE